MSAKISASTNRIVLKAGYTQGGAEHEEGILSGTCLPGMNLTLSGAFAVAGRDTWIVGATFYVGTGTADAPAQAPIRIAKENALIGRTVDDAYASGDNVLVHIAKPGDVLAVLVASGETVVKGQGLAAAATGKFAVNTTVAALEALENSGGALGADTLIQARVL